MKIGALVLGGILMQPAEAFFHPHRFSPSFCAPQSKGSTVVSSSSAGNKLDAVLRPSATAALGIGETPSFVDSLLHIPATWSVGVMLTIVGLLYIWEVGVEWAREKTPKTLRPVIESMLGEISGLGFIGLILGAFLHPFGRVIGQLSEEYLGEEEVLLETFEFLHSAFFEVGIAFFLIVGVMVKQVVDELYQLQNLSDIAITEEGTCTATTDKLADILGAKPISAGGCTAELSDIDALDRLVKNEKSPMWRELELTQLERGAECLLVRQRMIERNNFDESFRVEYYFEKVFGHSLKELVELSPLVWVPIIPALALANAVDLSNGVVNADSANAAASSGYFFSNLFAFVPNTALQILSIGWSVLNFWKMSVIKRMIMPTLIKNDDGTARMLPPKVQSSKLRNAFDSTPASIRPLERWLGKPARNIHEALFGEVGANGPDVYGSSIKYHTWLCVSAIVFFTTQILSRDLNAVLHPNSITVGDPDHLWAEIVTYGIFVLLNIGQLAIAPITFLNYSLITSIEDFTNEKFLQQALRYNDSEPTVSPDLSPSGNLTATVE
jgi:hypothetical protein